MMFDPALFYSSLSSRKLLTIFTPFTKVVVPLLFLLYANNIKANSEITTPDNSLALSIVLVVVTSSSLNDYLYEVGLQPEGKISYSVVDNIKDYCQKGYEWLFPPELHKLSSDFGAIKGVMNEPVAVFMMTNSPVGSLESFTNSNSNSPLENENSNERTPLIKRIGGSEPDPDPEPDPESNCVLGDEDDTDDEFNALKDRLKNCNKFKNIYRLHDQYRLLRSFARFARNHPNYAAQSYEAIKDINLVKIAQLTSGVLFTLGFAIDFGVEVFSNTGIAIAGAVISTTRVSLKTFVPIIFGRGIPEPVFLWSGIIIASFVDDLWAKVTDNGYYLELGSPEHLHFTNRIIVTTWINNLILSAINGAITKTSSWKYIRNGQEILIIADSSLLILSSWLAQLAQLSGYPAISFTAGVSPYGPAGKYPWPYCPPKIKWIPWGGYCNHGTESNDTCIPY